MRTMWSKIQEIDGKMEKAITEKLNDGTLDKQIDEALSGIGSGKWPETSV